MESGSNTQLRLRQEGVTLVIAADTWRHLIEVAHDKGWPSEHPPACYWGDIGLDVQASDARRLAGAFETMGEYLTKRESQSANTELVQSLHVLAIFCQEGGFRVC